MTCPIMTKIKAIPGVKLVKMPRSRELSRCCGAGCGCAAAFKPLAAGLALNRLKEAEATGADKIITTCPFCNLNLNNAAKEIGSLPTLDVTQLAFDAL